jgi:hypothetical protein
MTFGHLSHRRAVLRGGAGAIGLAALGGRALAQSGAKQVKVAAIYTVPTEQQWVSRIHKALNAAKDRGEIAYKFSESVANNDYERVMRQYAEEGSDLVIGEIFGVERQARRVAAAYPKVAFLMGSSFGPSKPNLAVFDNFIQEPSYLTGMVAGRATKSNLIGMVGGYAIPEVNRLMHAFMDGARAMNPNVKFLVTFINSWYDPPKAKEAAFAMIDKGATFSTPSASASRCREGERRQGDRQRHRHLVAIPGNGARQRALAHGADGRPCDPGGEGWSLRGRRLRPVQPDAVWRREPRDGRETRPGDVVKLVREKEKEITDGLFRVNVNDAEPKAG